MTRLFRMGLSSLRFSAFTFVRTEVTHVTLSCCYGVLAASFWLVVLNANRYGGLTGTSPRYLFYSYYRMSTGVSAVGAFGMH